MILTILSIISLISSVVITTFKDLFRVKKIIILHYLIASIFLIIEIVTRSLKINYPALTSSYDVLILLSTIVLVILTVILSRDILNKKFIIISEVSTILILIGSLMLYSQISDPIPILKSNLLVIHVLFSFVGEALFLLGFISSIINLNHKFIYKTTLIGYLFYTLGALVLGSIWAYFAWGSFWNWDAKEIWALVTCLIYTLIIHSHKNIRVLNIVGFIASVITFIGVNYFIPSMHSYISV